MAEMTLAEKIGQLHQSPNDTHLNAEEIRAGRVGSVICTSSAFAGNEDQERVRARKVNEMQRVAVEESRLGIPLLVARDVIHGHRTVAPIPLGQAASWWPEGVKDAAEVAGLEAYADGIRWVFTPMLDIARDPRWGRVAEGFGEDPYLAGIMASAAVLGYQGDDLAAKGRVAACAKHFAGYGAAEGGRDYNTTEISRNTMRNIYLPPFKAAVDAGVASIMSGFHEIGGVPVSGNRWLLTDVLREEWGFEGVVVSDWGAVAELVPHGMAEDKRDAGAKGLLAGIDVDMAAEAYLDHLEELVGSGVVPLANVDQACRRVLELKAALGLFENPYTEPDLADEVHFSAAAQSAVLDLARKSAVLLRNNGLLPLPRKIKTLGVFGPLHDNGRELLGSWCLDGIESDVVTVLDGIKAEFEIEKLYHSDLPDEASFQARHCDVVIVVVGEHHLRSGENNCITTLDLPAGQTDFLAGVKRMGIPTVAVILAGRPLALPRALNDVDAILYAWQPGTLGGAAVAEILSGTVNPSGKLPVTFPRTVGQVPIYYNHKATGRPTDPYGHGWSRYIDEKDSPLYEFGFGLSYTTFGYSDLQVAPHGDGFYISAQVTNTGAVAGEEIVQLYLRDHAATVTRPVKELKGFARIPLKPGESRPVSFELSRHDLGFYGADEVWVTEPGRFTFWVGPNSREGLSQEILLG